MSPEEAADLLITEVKAHLDSNASDCIICLESKAARPLKQVACSHITRPCQRCLGAGHDIGACHIKNPTVGKVGFFVCYNCLLPGEPFHERPTYQKGGAFKASGGITACASVGGKDRVKPFLLWLYNARRTWLAEEFGGVPGFDLSTSDSYTSWLCTRGSVGVHHFTGAVLVYARCFPLASKDRQWRQIKVSLFSEQAR